MPHAAPTSLPHPTRQRLALHAVGFGLISSIFGAMEVPWPVLWFPLAAACFLRACFVRFSALAPLVRSPRREKAHRLGFIIFWTVTTMAVGAGLYAVLAEATDWSILNWAQRPHSRMQRGEIMLARAAAAYATGLLALATALLWQSHPRLRIYGSIVIVAQIGYATLTMHDSFY